MASPRDTSYKGQASRCASSDPRRRPMPFARRRAAWCRPGSDLFDVDLNGLLLLSSRRWDAHLEYTIVVVSLDAFRGDALRQADRSEELAGGALGAVVVLFFDFLLLLATALDREDDTLDRDVDVLGRHAR